MQIRLASEMQSDSIVDGVGIRTVIWTQGCPHHCPGCQNPQTHDFNTGFIKEVSDIKKDIDNLEIQDGITFSGGDPLCQVEACLEIAKYCKEKGLNIWCYTGYTFEQLIELSKSKESIRTFLEQVDVLVDGRFMMELRSYECKYRGSSNQRLVDVKRSLLANKVVELELLEKEKNFSSFGKEKYMYV